MYTRPLTVVTTYVAPSRSTFYTVRADLHNRRITCSWGKLGTEGRTRVHTFTTKDDAREFLETVEERRELRGYIPLIAH